MNPIYLKRVAAFKARHGIGLRNITPIRKRGYDAALLNRLTQDLSGLGTSTADMEIRYDIESLRNRSRMLERESDYASRFYHALVNNVLKDEVGYSLQMQCIRDDGKPDSIACDKIEEAWKEWSRPENCTVTGEESFFDVCALSLRSTARDGGILIKKVIDPEVNDFGFSLQLMEVDHIDVNYNTKLPSGNQVTMGVEKNLVGKTVAYHILPNHPGDQFNYRNSANRIRVDASGYIHYFVKHRVSQCMGVPWTTPAMLRLNHLRQYELAEIVASRNAAEKGGYFTSEYGQQFQGDGAFGAAGSTEESTFATGQDGEVSRIGTYNDSSAGSFDELPAGMKFVPYDPQHPMQQYGEFVKNTLFGVSSGMNMSYATLTGDLSNANYSSMRAGKIEEQEGFRKIQGHQIRHLCLPIFLEFIRASMLKKKINLPFSGFDRFNKPKFSGRRWPWVDPKTDVEAALMEIEGGLSTRTKHTEEQGEDLEQVFDTLKYEQELAKENGLDFSEKEAVQKPVDAKPSAT